MRITKALWNAFFAYIYCRNYEMQHANLAQRQYEAMELREWNKQIDFPGEPQG